MGVEKVLIAWKGSDARTEKGTQCVIDMVFVGRRNFTGLVTVANEYHVNSIGGVAIVHYGRERLSKTAR
jgi:hypothetical protein